MDYFQEFCSGTESCTGFLLSALEMPPWDILILSLDYIVGL